MRSNASKGLSNRLYVCPSVRPKILKTAVIHSEKGPITTLQLFLEGYGADSAIYDLLELQIQSFLIFLIIARRLRYFSYM